jgi:DNA-binding Lrp family transcriptional regulator
MPTAFVLINAELGSEEELTNQLKSMEEIKEVYFVYGIYDIIAKVEADTNEELKEVVTQKIRKLPKVRSTLTMVVIS